MLLNYKFMNYFIKNFKFIILTKLLLKRHIESLELFYKKF